MFSRKFNPGKGFSYGFKFHIWLQISFSFRNSQKFVSVLFFCIVITKYKIGDVG